MNHIKLRPDIVLTCICGKWILVAQQSAQNYCPYTAEINETGALIWELIQQGKDIQGIKESLKQKYAKADSKLIDQDVESYIVLLKENNYIL